jgi:ATP diphosphatase
MSAKEIKPSGKDERYTFDDLRRIMARLRDPDTGCPWDIAQDFHSIAPYTIEESYEVADAIERGCMDDLREELGDLLLQPVYHAQMAFEQDLFDIEDVIHGIAAKMVSRHPHVFGDEPAEHAADVNRIWDDRKAAEQREKSSNTLPRSVLDDVPRTFPALLRAQKLQKKAAKTGFEWRSIDGVLDKLYEEIQEIQHAIAQKDELNIEEEYGDILFVLVNFARMHGLSAETALRKANAKFTRRFHSMERAANAAGQALDDLSAAEMLALWGKTKKQNI